MTGYEKERIGTWLIDRLKGDGEMPEVRVCRMVTYTEYVDIPADIAVQGKEAIDDYIYESCNGYARRGKYWTSMEDWDTDDIYTVYDDCGDVLFTTDE